MGDADQGSSDAKKETKKTTGPKSILSNGKARTQKKKKG